MPRWPEGYKPRTPVQRVADSRKRMTDVVEAAVAWVSIGGSPRLTALREAVYVHLAHGRPPKPNPETV